MMVSAKQLRSLDYERGCQRKTRYSTRAEAVYAVERWYLEVALTFNDWGMEAYQCRYGRHWHVGHSYRPEAQTTLPLAMPVGLSG